MSKGDILIFYPQGLDRRLYYYVQKNTKRWPKIARMANVVIIRNDELGRRLAARIVGKLGGVREAEPCLAGRALTREELAGLAAKLRGRPLTEGIESAPARRRRVERAVLRAKPKVRAIRPRSRLGRRKKR